MDGWVETNRRLWDASVPHHLTSDFYDVDSFRAGRSSLDRLVLEAVGPVEGRSLLHLQCTAADHRRESGSVGQDTISWARLGADVTGVDFSGEAVAAARRLAEEVGVAVTFVEGDAQTLHLGRTFDVVFASWGALVWIPDLAAWMATAARHLRPGDGFVPREPYAAAEPFECVVEHTYAGARVDLPAAQFNHGLGEVVTAAVRAGLAIERLVEHPVVEWRALSFVEQDGEGFWRVPGDPLPLSYSLVATRPG